VTVTFGPQVGTGGVNTGVTGNATMAWASSNAATDEVGNAASGNTVNETGVGDREF
jgi:hypothetical protein